MNRHRHPVAGLHPQVEFRSVFARTDELLYFIVRQRDRLTDRSRTGRRFDPAGRRAGVRLGLRVLE